MADLRIENLRKTFSSFVAVEDFSLSVRRGELVTFLGPSGCGKTTTLRMIAGFVTPQSGRILFGGRDIAHLAPQHRNVGMVHQGYALFPHMTAAQNVAFGLEMRGVSKPEVARRVDEALAMVRMTDYGQRLPRQLSGGQQQRVALARAFVINPDVLLLDEPLSALDAKLREDVRRDIRKLQQTLGLTTILVTHDQEEALSTSDRIVVMHAGHIEQIGTPREIYGRPQSRFVADFMGSSNVLKGRLEDGLFVTDFGAKIMLPHGEAPAAGDVTAVAVRPEHIKVGTGEPDSHRNRLSGRLEDLEYLGSALVLKVRVAGGQEMLVKLPETASDPSALPLGAMVELSWDAGSTWPLHS
ncbi:ABC transporter ATP-binding protein [Chelatococcus sp. GCM10030263]|uniref:ABC transporter ATP-binding protein n=1 Tax=Chelatococcus sp. GCM10030263 TaxID=3273387 RepID=UPI003608241B